ncbi:MAG: tail fiber protein [Verrucomicrobiota bacterium]
MSEPIIGEIKLFAGKFAPRGWAICNGGLCPISQNTALFSMIGTSCGGDGITNFALPDLRGRVPVGVGSGPGLTPVALGECVGEEEVRLKKDELPEHEHDFDGRGTIRATRQAANTTDPTGAAFATSESNIYKSDPTGYIVDTFDPCIRVSGTTDSIGRNMPHENRQPSLGLHFIIALHGIFPFPERAIESTSDHD